MRTVPKPVFWYSGKCSNHRRTRNKTTQLGYQFVRWRMILQSRSWNIKCNILNVLVICVHRLIVILPPDKTTMLNACLPIFIIKWPVLISTQNFSFLQIIQPSRMACVYSDCFPRNSNTSAATSENWRPRGMRKSRVYVSKILISVHNVHQLARS